MNAAASSHSGLTNSEATARLAQFGPNRLREKKRRGFLMVARGTLREPMFLLLLLAAFLYLLFGDLGEGIFLLAGAMLSLGLVIVQELRSERALEALNDLAEPMARVVREGLERTIPAVELVPGDIIILGEGGRIPADALLIAGDAIQVDESALTGESAPVEKCAADLPPPVEEPIPGEQVSPHLFATTLVLRGQGLALVRTTGPATRVGRIGTALAQAVEEPTLVQRDLRRLIGRLGVLALSFCLLVLLVYGLVENDWYQGALTGLTLAISLIPQEFPMVLAIFMALGAWRLARHNVLVRRSAVIETLGATTILCVDKTGTLTENRMTLEAVWDQNGISDLRNGVPDKATALLLAAQRACAVRPHDPMDAAVSRIVGHAILGDPVRSYPLRPDFLAFVQVWPAADGGVLYAAKGAPETIIRLTDLDEAGVRSAEQAVVQLASLGMRVLAVAEARLADDTNADPAKVAYRFQGLLGFLDPVRADVPSALAEARSAGVSVAMITGDYPATALAVARAAGIDANAGVVTGADLAKGDGGPAHAHLSARIFARIMPEQKLSLVQAFRRNGHVVAMTGDGINDAPALSAAHIGIAMGKRGTDVAREAADLILLDDRFASIVGGIRLGRRIFTNLRRALTYITAIHVPLAGLALMPILLGMPPMLYPMHLVLLELLIDPLCSLVFEAGPSEEAAMKAPPRPAEESLFGLRQIVIAGFQGCVLLATILGFYAAMPGYGISDAEARAAAFAALIIGYLSLALAEAGTSRTPGRHRILFWSIAAAALLVLAIAMNVPPFPAILRFSSIPLDLLLCSIAIGALSGGWYWVARLVARLGSIP